ncbi:hypothetical protein GCM10011361_08880 [Muriicola marianensis]|uniref:DUF2851 family protein n=1 Tax=Muriicola marianensis TaxID=1324801 RepID=A0ABQ1QUJ1_9FLAO|nr:hypothetical protein GCM10011361_08880 [Muriicola marianensis]
MFTTSGDSLQVLAAGFLNTGSGPDFHHARIRIDDQLWSGHVELHIRASDWYLHDHHLDEAYNTVILHVVWCADAEVRRKDGTHIPTLDLSRYISSGEILKAPRVDRPLGTQGILCSSLLHSVPLQLVHSWKEELYGERVWQKSEQILRWKSRSAHFWDHLFFKALLKGFGLNLNGEAFASLANAISYRVLRRVRSDITSLESLLFGLCGLLERAGEVDNYSGALLREYRYLKSSSS